MGERERHRVRGRASMILLLLCLSFGLSAAGGTLVGDADGNRRVDAADAALLAGYLAEGTMPLPNPYLADCDGNGGLDVVDLVLALQLRGFSHITSVWANDGGDKVTPDELRSTANPASVSSRLWQDGTISLFGAKNETVSFNLVLESVPGAAAVQVQFNRLTGPPGAEIQSVQTSGDGVFNWTQRPIELFRVGYLQIQGLSLLAYETYDERHIPFRLRRPWTGEGFGSGGWADRPDHDKFYPDIAVPLELQPAFDIAANRNQSIWADITIPSGLAAGTYTGSLTVRERGLATHRVPVELEVHSFTLPDSPTAKTMLYYSAENINRRYLGEAYPSAPEQLELSRLIQDRHFLLAHRHRIALVDGGDDPADHPPAEWAARLDGSLFTPVHGYAGPGQGLPNDVYSVGTYGGWGWQDDGQAGMWQHTNSWVQWFEANAPGVEYFLYLIDESDDYAQIEQWAQWINANPGPGRRMKSMATIDAPAALAHTPSLDIPASLLGVGITPEWESTAAAYLGNPDKRFFQYNGTRPASGSFATDDDGVALRQKCWAGYKKGIQRWFYWESTYYNNFQGGTGETNVFSQAQTFGGPAHSDPELGQTGWNYTNGDGVLFYPGSDTVFPASSVGVNGPLASLRLKHWRRGLQDVEYLVLAAGVDPVRTLAIVNRRVPVVLWEYGVSDPEDPTWVRADISWSILPDDWETARAELADIIEGLRRAGE